MIEIRLPLSEELAQQLEDHFCEEYQQCWMLHEDAATREHELRGFFASNEEMTAALATLREVFPGLSCNPEILELEDRDWKEAYKFHFKPWSERGLHWVPVWEKETYPLPAGDEVVYLDPGMAFGTGNHETTRLCVRRLLDARDDWGEEATKKAVVDAGCGSGILAISARKLGFSKVRGFDIDPDSVKISLDNEKLCGLDDSIDFLWADLEEGLQKRKADLLLANILAPVLCAHAEQLCDAVRPRGRLVLSGLLKREVDDVHAVFAKLVRRRTRRKVPLDSRVDGDWADLCYRF